MTITIEEVSRLANVSRGTVSNVLNNVPFVRKKNREKVLKAIKILNYHPDNIARSLVSKRTKTIGLIVTDIMVSFFPNIAYSIELFFSEKGYGVLLCQSCKNSEREREKIYTLLGKKVDGLIMSPWDVNSNIEVYKELKNRKFPFVLIDCYTDDIECNYVICDDYKGAFEAVEYLIKAGHKKIGHLPGPNNLTTAINRKKGYIESIKKYNLSPIIPEINDNKDLERNGYIGMQEIFKNHKNDLPTGIFAFTDSLAIGAIKAIKKNGLKVPEDISIIGFADLSSSELIGLSTIRQPQEDLGKAASEILFNNINSRKDTNIQKKILPTQLIIRDTVKKLSA